MCGSTDGIQLHHLTYERLGEENAYDLLPVCAECHKKIHEIYPEVRDKIERIEHNYNIKVRERIFDLSLQRTIDISMVIAENMKLLDKNYIGDRSKFVRGMNGVVKWLVKNDGIEGKLVISLLRALSGRKKHNKPNTVLEVLTAHRKNALEALYRGEYDDKSR